MPDFREFTNTPEAGWQVDKVVTLTNPITGETTKDYISRLDMNDLMAKGYKPATEGDRGVIQDNYGLDVGMAMESYENPYEAKLEQSIGTSKDIMDVYDKQYGGFGQDNPYLEQAMGDIGNVREMAQSTEASPYAKALLDEQDVLGKMKQDELRGEQASNLGTAYSRMASTGGLDSGQRERMLGQSNRMGLMAQQGASAQDQRARTGIMAGDARSKMQMMQSLPGMMNPYAMAADQRQQQRAQLGTETTGNIYSQEGY
jgi:hypothetical protein